jgi:hypothetical protein
VVSRLERLLELLEVEVRSFCLRFFSLCGFAAGEGNPGDERIFYQLVELAPEVDHSNQVVELTAA